MKIQQWEKFGKLLSVKDKQSFLEMVSTIRNMRTEIEAADEADIGVAILLAVITDMNRRLDEWHGSKERDSQNRL